MNPSKLLLRSFVLVILALGMGAAAAERSAFVQGHWWNPARAGSGFEFFNVDDRAMVIWYTYEASGRPVWYTAQGSVATMGSVQWPLLRHTWANGRKGPVSTVGWLRVSLGGFESATVSWNVSGSEGSLPIEPFRPSTGSSQPDRTGSWYAPANSGWGFSLTEQGDVFGGVLFTYDAAGEPTWAAGFGREREAAELFTFEGACPSCVYRPSVSRPVGRVAFTFSGDTEAVMSNRLTLAMPAGVQIDGARLAQLGRPASMRPADRIETFAGGKFSFVEPGAVSAPNAEAQVSIQRTGGASGAFDIYYTYEGQGCARKDRGGPVRFGEGDTTPKVVTVPMRDQGLCMVWVVPPPAPAGIGAQSPIGINVVPVVPGCPRPSFVAYAELGGVGNPLLQRQRSGQTLYMPLPRPADGRASGQITFSESPTAATPQPVTLEISINRCPGIIETDTASFCNARSTNGNYNSIVYLTRAQQGIDATNVARYGYCWAGDAGPYYINARWTYASCPSGMSDCGFAIQQNHGPL